MDCLVAFSCASVPTGLTQLLETSVGAVVNEFDFTLFRLCRQNVDSIKNDNLISAKFTFPITLQPLWLGAILQPVMCCISTGTGGTFQVHRLGKLYGIDNMHAAFILSLVRRVSLELRIGLMATVVVQNTFSVMCYNFSFSETNHRACANTFSCSQFEKLAN